MIVAILQARLSSTRLPGKVLAPVLGTPMVLRQIERLERCTEIDELVVATSIEASDDTLVETLEASGIVVRRGPLQDVGQRYADVLAEFAPDSFIRLTADCPLADPAVIDRVVREHRIHGADYTSNTIVRTYPQGLDVECVRTVAFERMRELHLSDPEREHVTMAIYTRPDEFTIRSVTQDINRSIMRWTVDRPDDLAFVRDVYAALYPANPHFDQEDIVHLLDERPSLNHTN